MFNLTSKWNIPNMPAFIYTFVFNHHLNKNIKTTLLVFYIWLEFCLLYFCCILHIALIFVKYLTLNGTNAICIAGKLKLKGV